MHKLQIDASGSYEHMTSSSNSAALVTGASKGIGRATALRLDALGFRVFAGVRSATDGEALASEASRRLTPLQLDVTDGPAVAAAADRIRALRPAFLGVVNNAAISIPGPIEYLGLEAVREQFEVNFFGTVRLTQALLPAIRDAQSGRIVNVSSINARLAQPWIGAYSASKWALEGWSDALRRELRPWRIPVVLVQPGAVDTPIFRTSRARGKAAAEEMPPAARQSYPRIVRAMLERPGRTPRHAVPPERVARTIARALTARRPRTRYMVGWDTRLVALLTALLPTKVVDRLI